MCLPFEEMLGASCTEILCIYLLAFRNKVDPKQICFYIEVYFCYIQLACVNNYAWQTLALLPALTLKACMID